MTPEKPVITILILIAKLNRAQLKRCLDSIRLSTYKNYEILIVINNSKNDKLNELWTTNNIRYIKLQQNSGVTGYNVGFLLSKGKYIFVLDVDCQLRPNTLDRAYKELRDQPQTVAIIATNVVNPINGNQQINQKYALSHPLFTFPGGASLIRKQAINKVGFYDPAFFLWLHEDDLAMRILGAGYTIKYASNVIVYHHDISNKFRGDLTFFLFRNKAWLNIKHFSFIFFPVLLVRDLIWLIRYPIHIKSFFSLLIGLYGYILGYLTFIIPLLNRKVLPMRIQKQILNFYYFYRN